MESQNKVAHSHKLHLPKIMSYSGQKPSRQARIGFVIIAIVLLYCFVDLLLSAMTMGRIFPGVSVAGKDMSFKTRAQAYQIIKDEQLQKSFTVKVGDKTFTATSADLGANYDLQTSVNTAYSVGHDQPLPLIGLATIGNRGQNGLAYELNQSALKDFTNSVINSVGYSATNATLKIENGQIIVVPDKNGLRVDEKKLRRILSLALADAKNENIFLEPQVLEAEIKAKDTQPAKAEAEKLIQSSIVLSYEGKTFAATQDQIGHMITFEEQEDNSGKKTLVAKVDSKQVAGYVQSIANQVDIKPINKKIEVKNGVQSVTQEGKNGLAVVQQPVIDAIVSGLNTGSAVKLDLTTVPVEFKTDYNRTVSLDYSKYVEVNLSQQRLWAWQDNQVVFSTPITSGASGYGFGTPTGLSAIYAKERSRYLNGAQYGWGYNVYVDYWMPFNGGVGLHDADWRSSFGGQDYINGGSHGCVNMSKSAAAFMYSWVDIGTPVWVHY